MADVNKYINRITKFTSPSGHEGMTINCGKYDVEIFKNINKEEYSNSIKFTEKITGKSNCTNVFKAFIIDWDEEKDGGKISIKYKDRWGSEMSFIHYEPSDIVGMFDFIGRGYKIFEYLFGKQEDLLDDLLDLYNENYNYFNHSVARQEILDNFIVHRNPNTQNNNNNN